jgi:hypothetical protein
MRRGAAAIVRYGSLKMTIQSTLAIMMSVKILYLCMLYPDQRVTYDFDYGLSRRYASPVQRGTLLNLALSTDFHACVSEGLSKLPLAYCEMMCSKVNNLPDDLVLHVEEWTLRLYGKIVLSRRVRVHTSTLHRHMSNLPLDQIHVALYGCTHDDNHGLSTNPRIHSDRKVLYCAQSLI